MSKKRWTEREICDVLSQSYSEQQGYVLLRQVPNGTGLDKSRTADALAMQVWPSRGLRLYGFEIKVSRSDWRNELRNAAKAESIAQYCHYWFIVAPVGVVPVDELPTLWGLLEVSDAGIIKRTKEAPQQEFVAPIDMTFLAGVLRGAGRFQNEPHPDLARKFDEGYKAGYKDASAQLSELKMMRRLVAQQLRDCKRIIDGLSRSVSSALRDYEALAESSQETSVPIDRNGDFF